MNVIVTFVRWVAETPKFMIGLVRMTFAMYPIWNSAL